MKDQPNEIVRSSNIVLYNCNDTGVLVALFGLYLYGCTAVLLIFVLSRAMQL